MAPEADGNNQIFRAKAVEAAGGGNRLNTLSPIISPRLWLVTVAVGLLLATIVAWGVIGRIPVTVVGSGIYLRGDRLDAVHAMCDGYVSEILVKEGQRVAKGACVVVVGSGKGGDAVTAVLAPSDGRVVSIDTELGDFVQAGRAVAILASGDESPHCLAFVPLSEGKSVALGMPARVTFATADAQGGASVVGTISHVDNFITSAERMLGRVPSSSLVDSIRQQYGSVMAVTILIDADEGGAGGLKWSAGGGSKGLLVDGAPCDVEVTIGEIRPAALVMPGIDSSSPSQ